MFPPVKSGPTCAIFVDPPVCCMIADISMEKTPVFGPTGRGLFHMLAHSVLGKDRESTLFISSMNGGPCGRGSERGSGSWLVLASTVSQLVFFAFGSFSSLFFVRILRISRKPH